MNKSALVALSAIVLLGACTTTPTPAPETSAQAAPAPETIAKPVIRPFPDDSFYDLLVAEFALRDEQYELALGNYLQQSHRTRDRQVTARATRLAQFLQADKAALDAARLWVELEPANLEANYSLATQLAKNEQPLAAMPYMVVVLEGGGKSNFAIIAAGAMNAPAAEQQQLTAMFDQQIDKHPKDLQLRTGKALLLQQQGQPEKALVLIRDVLQTSPFDMHAVIIEAKLLQQLNRTDEAFARLEMVLLQYPDNRRLRLQYARLLLQKDVNKAREQFDILLQQNPGDPDLLMSLALLNREIGDVDAATRHLEQLIDSDQHSDEAHMHLGQMAEQRDDRDGAISHYQQVGPSANFIASVRRVVILLAQRGDTIGARGYLAGLRERYPEQAIPLYLVEGDLLLELKDYHAGHQLLSEALAIHPDQPNLLYTRGIFSEKRRDVALMEKDLRTLLDLDPNNAAALNALGYGLVNLTTRYDEAYTLIQRALEVKPGDPAILDSLGWVEFKRGNLQQALTLLEQAHRDFPDPEVAAHLGEVLWQLGRHDDAETVWRQALQQQPNSAIVHETVERVRGAALPAP